MSLNAYIFRYMCTKSDRKRDAGLTTPAGIVRHDNIQYGTDRKWHLLDVYRPKDAADPLPVIVSFHGGGWVYGTKEVYQYYCMCLAEKGFAVVNYNYRLAPRYRFPAPFEDTNALFQWITDHAAEYGLDTARMFGAGDSAGALGIALYACILTNPAYAKRYAFAPPAGITLRGLALNCGLYTTADKADALRDFLPKQNPAEALNALDLVQHITKDFPPCYVMTANKDFLKEEPKLLLPVLEKCGVRYEYKLYGDDAQPRGHVFHCNIRDELAVAANDAECAFFRSIFAEEST